jgi:tripartite-type tricarboxylate transporter receptor subunit TctC
MFKLLRVAAVAALCAVAAAGAVAQTFTKPIKVIVPYPAGDLGDVISRLLQPSMQESLGQPIVIENRPGASGLLGLQSSLQGPNDGHTFVMGQMGSMAVAPITNKQPIDVRAEFVPVAMAYTNYLLLAAHPSVPAKTIPELVAYSKANPGKLRLGTNGEGGFPHLSMELLQERTGMDFIHVPYKGNNQVLADVMGGQIDLAIGSFTTFYPHAQSGKLNAIAMTGKSRSAFAPAVASFGEGVPGYEALGWFGFFTRKGSPPATITAFNTAVNTALAKPDIAQKTLALGLDTVAGTPAQFGAIWMNDYDKWGKLLRTLKLEAK